MEEIVLDIERPVAGGRMLARHEGRVVFVAGALPGERVRAVVERQSRQMVWARTIEVDRPSTDRREPPSDPACGGLDYAHVRYERQLALKSEVIADAFRRVGKIDLGRVVSVSGSPEDGYRLRARLHVRDGRAGFFREGSQTWCDAAPGRQLLPETLPAVQAQLSALGARVRDVDAVTVAENVAATERVLHLEPMAGISFADLARVLPLVPGITGVTTNGGVARSAPSGSSSHGSQRTRSAPPHPRPIVLGGSPTVTDAARDLFGGDSPVSELAAWVRHAASFFQGNRYRTGALVRHVLDSVTAEWVADLYAGVGLFSVALAARGAHVVAVEGDALAAADLSANATAWRERLRCVNAPIERARAAIARASGRPIGAVIVDPPRTGMSAAALSEVLEIAPDELVYVSCDPPTLARDTALVLRARYEIGSAVAFDLFPNTSHVETVVRFLRSRALAAARDSGGDQAAE